MEHEVQSYSKTIKVCGMEEGELRERIHDLLSAGDRLVYMITSCPGEVSIRISAQAETEDEARVRVKGVVRELKIRLGSSIYTTNPDTTLEETIVQLLKEQNMTVTTVESCTGGLLSGRLTDVPGVSEVFKQGFVTYSNKAKRKFVGVKKMTLKKHTAVSEQTAKEMAKGGAILTNADACVSVTGYAGPEGGEDGQPAGLVYIGCSVKGNLTVEEYRFSGDRRAVRQQAVVYALILLRKCILENYRI